jgi:hypothetical protein
MQNVAKISYTNGAIDNSHYRLILKLGKKMQITRHSLKEHTGAQMQFFFRGVCAQRTDLFSPGTDFAARANYILLRSYRILVTRSFFNSCNFIYTTTTTTEFPLLTLQI